MESDESLGYHWGSWLGDGIQPRDGLTEGDEVNSLELSLLLSLAGERAVSSPAAGQDNSCQIRYTTFKTPAREWSQLYVDTFLQQSTLNTFKLSFT